MVKYVAKFAHDLHNFTPVTIHAKWPQNFFIYSTASISPIHQAETDEDQSVGGRAWAMDLFECMGVCKIHNKQPARKGKIPGIYHK